MLAAIDLRARRAPRPLGMTGGVPVTSVICFALAFFALTNLGRVLGVSSAARNVPILLNDLLLGLVLAAGGIAALSARRLVLDAPALAALAFAGVGGVSALLAIPRFGLSPAEFVISVAYLVRWLAYFGLYLVVINHVPVEAAPRVWRALERAILVFASFGIFQSFFLPGFAQIVDPDGGWDIQGHRLVSTLLDPNFAGALVIIALLVQCAQLAMGARVPTWKPLLLVTALVLTVSRSSILGFLVGLCVIFAARGLSKRLFGFGLGVFLLMLPFLPLVIRFADTFGRFSLDGSAAARVVTWLRAIEVFLANPLIGIGFNTYGFVGRAYGYHTAASSFDFNLDGGLLFIAVMTGSAGLGLYLAMLGLVLARCRRIWRDAARGGEERGLALGAAAVTCAVVVHSIFLNSLLLPFVMQALWILWGITFLLARRPKLADEERTRSAGPTLASLGVPA